MLSEEGIRPTFMITSCAPKPWAFIPLTQNCSQPTPHEPVNITERGSIGVSVITIIDVLLFRLFDGLGGRQVLTRREHFLAGRSAVYLFITGRGNRLDGGGVRHTFYALSRQIGLRSPTASHGPRLHDFRHRFAVETLLKWYRSGEDVERRLPLLSTYLGHVHPSDTYWYLSLCPELMGLAVKLLEYHWGDDS